jgi:hypothetical protein
MAVLIVLIQMVVAGFTLQLILRWIFRFVNVFGYLPFTPSRGSFRIATVAFKFAKEIKWTIRQG